MKRIGYISAARIKGAMDLGPGSTLTVHGASILAGPTQFHNTILAFSSFGLAGPASLGGPVACSSSLGVAGPTNLNGPVTCIGSLAIGGPLTMHQVVNALQLPAADPTVAGQLWVNAGVVTRSAG